jgi:NUMOD4 motif-containing protein/HNH endonuclease
MSEEIFKPAIGYEGNYEVSNNGRVSSVKRSTRENRFIMRSFKAPSGHMRVSLSVGNKEKKESVHRMVAKAFIENPLSKHSVNHKDGNPANNNVDNLEWATQAENTRHAVRVLGKMHGDKCAHSKITPEDFDHIRSLFVQGAKPIVMAKCYGVSVAAVCYILNGKNWRHWTRSEGKGKHRGRIYAPIGY